MKFGVIVISHPEKISHEASIINALFKEGLELFHIRKPGYSEREVMDLVNDIDSRYHPKVVLHQHHGLSGKFNTNRIHFSESSRMQAGEDELKQWKEKGYILSTSVHSLPAYEALPGYFDYTFYGPVFESISKQGYAPVEEESRLNISKNRNSKIIAIGGISAGKIDQIKALQFDGVALLGTIWTDPEQAVTHFKECLSKSIEPFN